MNPPVERMDERRFKELWARIANPDRPALTRRELNEVFYELHRARNAETLLGMFLQADKPLPAPPPQKGRFKKVKRTK